MATGASLKKNSLLGYGYKLAESHQLLRGHHAISRNLRVVLLRTLRSAKLGAQGDTKESPLLSYKHELRTTYSG